MQGETYVQGTVTIGTSPTLICSPNAGSGGVALYASAAGVFVGGSTVATSGAYAGPQLPPTTLVVFPTSAGPTGLYGISTAGTQTVSYSYSPV